MSSESAQAYPELEVAKHTTRSSCWMIINDAVYDVTSFLDDHPGGEDILIDASGRDATREFEDVGHSSEAREQLKGLLLGPVRAPTEEELQLAREEAKQRGDNPNASDAASSSSTLVRSMARWLIPVMLIGVAFLLRRYGAKYATDV